MDYVASVSNGLGYCLAVEKLLNVEAPPRAQVVGGLPHRAEPHCQPPVWLGRTRSTSAPITPVFYCFREREEGSTFSKVLAARGSPRTPSASADCNNETYDTFEQDVRAFLRHVPPKVDEYEEC